MRDATEPTKNGIDLNHIGAWTKHCVENVCPAVTEDVIHEIARYKMKNTTLYIYIWFFFIMTTTNNQTSSADAQ